MQVKKGATDVTSYHVLVDSAAGTVETGATISNFDLTYVRDRAAAVKVDASELSYASDAHKDNAACEVNATTAPGLYRVDWPDAAFSDNAAVDKVQLCLVAGDPACAPSIIEVDLVKRGSSDIYEIVSDAIDDISDLSAKVDSDSLLYISDFSDIISDLTKTALSDLATAVAVSDVKSELVIISDAISDVKSELVVASDALSAVSAKIESDSVLYEADHDKTQSDIAELSTKVESDSLLYVSDLSDILSDLAKTKLSDLATAAAVSDVKSELVILSDAISDVKSELVVASDAVLALSTKIDSDAVEDSDAHVKTQSDIADISAADTVNVTTETTETTVE